MKKITLVLLITVSLAMAAWITIPSSAQDAKSEPSSRSNHLLDRGTAAAAGPAERGGTAPPTGPTPIFFPPASTMAVPVPPGFGLPGGGAFPPSGGGFVGNLFLPGVPGYPPTFLTSGATSGFDVTGAFAWHLAPTAMASLARMLGAAAVVPPPATMTTSPASIVPGFMTATVSTGTPAPSALVGGPGIFAPPVRVTSPGVGIFCGLGVGAAGFPPIAAGPAGNGLGGITGAPPLPPIRTAMIPFGTGSPIAPIPASPAAYIAGCFADSSTTPVELQAFHVE